MCQLVRCHLFWRWLAGLRQRLRRLTLVGLVVILVGHRHDLVLHGGGAKHLGLQVEDAVAAEDRDLMPGPLVHNAASLAIEDHLVPLVHHLADRNDRSAKLGACRCHLESALQQQASGRSHADCGLTLAGEAVTGRRHEGDAFASPHAARYHRCGAYADGGARVDEEVLHVWLWGLAVAHGEQWPGLFVGERVVHRRDGG